jgi:hypothetical protein
MGLGKSAGHPSSVAGKRSDCGIEEHGAGGEHSESRFGQVTSTIANAAREARPLCGFHPEK